MQVGMLTAPFNKEPLSKAVEFAGQAGFDALEIAVTPCGAHFDPYELNPAAAEELRSALTARNLVVTSLAYYANVTHADPDERATILANLQATVDAAATLGVGVVCTMAGMPVPGKTKMQTIEQEIPGALGPVVEYAGSKGIKIALENWYATNIQHLGHWDRLFEVLPASNFGLNFDPSHLFHQQIDYLEAVDRFAPRIFHTHAKDTEVKEHRLRYTGNQEAGWWRYVIPGYGKIHWGEYVARLRRIGYNGVLSIEHEDAAFGREEGFVKGLRHLRQLI